MSENKPLILNIPFLIFNDPNLNDASKLILGEIFSLLKIDRRWCWASNKHFGDLFGHSNAKVSWNIQQLEKLGWIKSNVVKDCNLDGCGLQNKGWHRHIFPGRALSNILDSLSNSFDTLEFPDKTLSNVFDSPYQNFRDTLSKKPTTSITVSNSIEEERKTSPTKRKNKTKAEPNSVPKLTGRILDAYRTEFPFLTSSEIEEVRVAFNRDLKMRAANNEPVSVITPLFKGWLRRRALEKQDLTPLEKMFREANRPEELARQQKVAENLKREGIL